MAAAQMYPVRSTDITGTTASQGCLVWPALQEVAILTFRVVIHPPSDHSRQDRGPDPSGVNICQLARTTTARSVEGECLDGWHRLVRCRTPDLEAIRLRPFQFIRNPRVQPLDALAGMMSVNDPSSALEDQHVEAHVHRDIFS